MEQMRIETATAGTQGNVVPLAQHLMDGAFSFFRDPEGEKEYQEWKRQRENARKGA